MSVEFDLRKGEAVIGGRMQDGHAELMIWQHQHKRGTGDKCHLSDDELGKPVIILRFHDADSLGVLIRGLQRQHDVLANPGPRWRVAKPSEVL